jgi:iterative type I PKS product template protein
VEADLCRQDLRPMVQGHKVYGVPLCTPSVYANIALTIGDYAKRFAEQGSIRLSRSAYGVEVANMNIQSALVANSAGKPQFLHTHASFDPKRLSLYCTFSSVDENGKVEEQHASCLVRLFDLERVRATLHESAPLIKSRISNLQAQLQDFGNTFRYSKAMIYKMVGQLADFDPKYRALEEITLDSDALEATGKVNFTKVLSEGTFHTNPAYIDALSQLGGFVMNGNEGVDLDKELFVNHGWKSLRLLEPVDPMKTYTTHVKMVEGKDKLWTGDITILDGGVVVGMFSGVALQGVPKRLMSYIVNAASKRTTRPRMDKSTALVSNQAQTAAPISAVVKTATTRPSVATTHLIEDCSTSTAITIISQESGIAISELTDDTRFDDIGVDSLLGLVVTSRIRDELGLDVASTTFLETRTVGSFRKFLSSLPGTTEHSINITKTVEEEVAPTDVPSTFGKDNTDTDVVWLSALSILSEESGIDIAELTDDTYFSDIGVDSLLSLVVVSRMRDELELDIPDQSLFLEYPTVASLKARMVGGLQYPPSDSGLSDSDISTDNSSVLTPGLVAEDPMEEILPPLKKDKLVSVIEKRHPVKSAWSVILQGSPRHASERLFLFPDGCGAATSYLKLPSLSPSTAVIAFNSPFMK